MSTLVTNSESRRVPSLQELCCWCFLDNYNGKDTNPLTTANLDVREKQASGWVNVTVVGGMNGLTFGLPPQTKVLPEHLKTMMAFYWYEDIIQRLLHRVDKLEHDNIVANGVAAAASATASRLMTDRFRGVERYHECSCTTEQVTTSVSNDSSQEEEEDDDDHVYDSDDFVDE
jgi:hypothetical protein